MTKVRQYSPRTLVAFCLIVISLGVIFRFTNLDQKFYWFDEVRTSIWLSGYTPTKVSQTLANGQLLTPADLQRYQYPIPETTILDVASNLARYNPQHPPLFYILERWWVKFWGHSIAVARSLPAIFGTLALLPMYWLCRELFQSNEIAWVGTTLMAISPFFVLYSQEARQYSLWSGLVLLLCTAFLRAIRLNTLQSWRIYCLTLVINIYTFLFTVFVALGHGIYILVIEKLQLSQKVKRFIQAILLAFILCLPWFAVLRYKTGLKWIEEDIGFSTTLQINLIDISRIFVDQNVNIYSSTLEKIWPIVLSLSLIVYSIYFLRKKSSKQEFLFVVILIGVTQLILILPDLLLGGQRSIIARYLTASYLGILLAVAYMLGSHLLSSEPNQRAIGKVLFITTILAGIISCGTSLPADTWWNKDESYNSKLEKTGQDYIEIAQVINSSSRPLIFSELVPYGSGGYEADEIMPLSHLLKPKVRLLLVEDAGILKFPQEFSDVFVYTPSPPLKKKFERQGYFLKPIGKDNWQLWLAKAKNQ
jgi:uncharacterized membrane protein